MVQPTPGQPPSAPMGPGQPPPARPPRPVVRTPVSPWRWVRRIGIALGILLVLGIGAYERHFGCGLPPGCLSERPGPIAIGQTVRSSLTGLRPQRSFELTVSAAGRLVIDLQGDFDPYLELYRPGDRRPFAEDDDGGDGLSSRLAVDLQPGLYEIRVRGFERSARGPFSLTVREGSADDAATGEVLQQVPRVVFQGTVASVSGPAPVKVGTSCTVTTGPATGSASALYNCRVWVRCGAQLLYGGGQAG